MNLFRRAPKPVAKATPVPPAPLSELEIAERAVETADKRIAAVNKEFHALVERYQIRIDRNGCIASAILPDHTKRDEIENLVRSNLRDRDAALTAFYRALSVWSGLKPGN